MAVSNAARKNKTVASPNAEYESLKPLWNRSRAVCSGERFVKEFDGIVDTHRFTNMLIPFSPSMTQEQYNFYKAEAELPGITAQFSKTLVSGLLRKQPILTLPDDAPEEASDWIMNEFSQDDAPLTSFMDKALKEELQTTRSWIHVDYPQVENTEVLTTEDLAELKPYPILWDAESVINWRYGLGATGKNMLNRVVKRGFVEVYDDAEYEFHPKYIERIWVHELDESGMYQIRVFDRRDEASEVPVISGYQHKDMSETPFFELVDTISNILKNGERLDFIPIWPLNGSLDPSEPLLMAIIDKEIALYNKISRRNHLLYGAATYTPIVHSDMEDIDFQEIVNAGLGTWIHVNQDDNVTVLDTPTDALKDMEAAIASAIEEMAKLGIRMLAPEGNNDQSGVALEIRNATQTAQLGTLNARISNVLSQIIVLMLNWRYNTDYDTSDIEFSLSADFNPVPLGADWLRLATEWYEMGYIPRSIWLTLLKQNDMIDSDYNDEEGIQEIDQDDFVKTKEDEIDYAARMTEATRKASE